MKPGVTGERMQAEMEAIVLAGGLGTRLAGHLGGVPKPMAEIGGRPLLTYILRQLCRAGCSRVLLSVGHLRGHIQGYFGGSFEGIPLHYVVERQPLGTGGAIRKALAEARVADVLVVNGDTLTDVDFPAMLQSHRRRRAGLTMAVVRQQDVSRYGKVVLFGDQVVSFVEKGRFGPGWINAGIYVLPKGLAWPVGLPDRFSFEKDYLAAHSGRLNIRAEICGDYFIDIGVPEDLVRAQTEIPAHLMHEHCLDWRAGTVAGAVEVSGAD